MRKTVLSIAGIAAMALAGPGVAAAHGRHHARHHRTRHHVRIRFETIDPTGTTTTGTTPTAPSPAPATDTAGSVTSFANGVLTITLNDGSTVTGKVTDATRIECPSASSGDDDAAEDQTGDDAAETAGGETSSGDAVHMDGDHGGSGDDNGGGDDQGEDRGDSSSCSSSALVAGAKVREAELEISSAGAVFRKVELA